MIRMTGMTGRKWAYVGVGLGIVASVAANVLHSFVPPEAAARDWRPPAGAIVGAVFWPLALFVTLEIMVRVDWPAPRRWWLVRWPGLGAVVAVAAVVSYRHMSGLLEHWGTEDKITIWLGPLAVDGLVIVATGALAVTSSSWRDEKRTAADKKPVRTESPADKKPRHQRVNSVRSNSVRRGRPGPDAEKLATVQRILSERPGDMAAAGAAVGASPRTVQRWLERPTNGHNAAPAASVEV